MASENTPESSSELTPEVGNHFPHPRELFMEETEWTLKRLLDVNSMSTDVFSELLVLAGGKELHIMNIVQFMMEYRLNQFIEGDMRQLIHDVLLGLHDLGFKGFMEQVKKNKSTEQFRLHQRITRRIKRPTNPNQKVFDETDEAIRKMREALSKSSFKQNVRDLGIDPDDLDFE